MRHRSTTDGGADARPVYTVGRLPCRSTAGAVRGAPQPRNTASRPLQSRAEHLRTQRRITTHAREPHERASPDRRAIAARTFLVHFTLCSVAALAALDALRMR